MKSARLTYTKANNFKPKKKQNGSITSRTNKMKL